MGRVLAADRAALLATEPLLAVLVLALLASVVRVVVSHGCRIDRSAVTVRRSPVERFTLGLARHSKVRSACIGNPNSGRLRALK